MCGRYTVTKPEDIGNELQAQLGEAVRQDPWWKPRFNVAPTQPAPVITAHGRERMIALMRWGLVPHWAGRSEKKPPLMINARLESLQAKQVFRDALERKRCLVPTDGFFEWVRAQGTKAPPKPFYFHPRGRYVSAFAGLWARSTDGDGNELHSFTIITARANDLVRPIHDRMPIVLAPGCYDAWLDPAVDGEAARELLGEPAPEDWTREPVSTRVNKVDHDDPDCIAPDEPKPDEVQGRLFD